MCMRGKLRYLLGSARGPQLILHGPLSCRDARLVQSRVDLLHVKDLLALSLRLLRLLLLIKDVVVGLVS